MTETRAGRSVDAPRASKEPSGPRERFWLPEDCTRRVLGEDSVPAIRQERESEMETIRLEHVLAEGVVPVSLRDM
jgi:hypothetical protein